MLGGDVQRAMMTGAVARGIEAAGSNENGAMMGFMGMNMAMNAGNNVLGGMPAAPQQTTPQQPTPGGWKCSCGATNTGAFCSSCGAKKPEAWTCSCGQSNTGKFCAECGKSKPAAPKKYKCDKCGWVPADPEHPPKFCPECGDPFNEDDLV